MIITNKTPFNIGVVSILHSEANEPSKNVDIFQFVVKLTYDDLPCIYTFFTGVASRVGMFTGQ